MAESYAGRNNVFGPGFPEARNIEQFATRLRSFASRRAVLIVDQLQ